MLYTCTAVAKGHGYRNTNAQLRGADANTFCTAGFLIDLSHYHQYSLLASLAEGGFAQSQPLGIILTIAIAIKDLEAVLPVSVSG